MLSVGTTGFAGVQHLITWSLLAIKAIYFRIAIDSSLSLGYLMAPSL